MDPEAISAFASRPWDELAALKRRYAAERYRREGPAASLRIARALYARFRELDAAGPAAVRRKRDVAHHVELKRMLERVAGVIP